MLIAAWGVSGVGAGQLGRMFRIMKMSFGLVVGSSLVKQKMNENPFPEPAPIIFRGAKNFSRSYNKFRKTNIVAFVLDAPMELSFLNIPMLGSYPVDQHVWRFSKLTEREVWAAYATTQPYFENGGEVIYEPKPVISSVVKSFKDSSLLAPVQTFLYTIKDQECRAKVNTAIKGWLTGDLTFDKLEYKIAKSINVKAATRLTLILQNDKFKTLRKAAEELRKNPDRAKTIAAQYKVASYDLKYLVH